MQDNIVIVIDTSNYKKPYTEKCPFKAKVIEKYDNEIVVKSITTNKKYELYYDQVLEYCSIEDIKKLINLNNYGK